MTGKYSEIIRLRDAARINREMQRLKTYTLIIGEVQRSHHPDYRGDVKYYTDEDVYKTVKTLINTWEEFPAAANQEEIAIAKALLPVQLSFDDISRIIESKKFEHIGHFMSHLKSNYTGRYDGAMAKHAWDLQK